MIETIVNALSGAFTQVADLLGDVLGDAFTAVAQLSSGIFGGDAE